VFRAPQQTHQETVDIRTYEQSVAKANSWKGTVSLAAMHNVSSSHSHSLTTLFIRSDTALSLSEDGLEKNSHPVSSLSDESIEADSVNQEGSMISDQDTHLHNFCKCLSTDAPWPCVLHACFASS
jgi:hypothetical protein